MPSPAATQAMIERRGQPMTLRRVETGVPPIEVACFGFVRGATAQPLIGDLAQDERRILLAPAQLIAAGWPVPPVRGDEVTVDGIVSAIESCATVRIGAALDRYVLVIKG